MIPSPVRHLALLLMPWILATPSWAQAPAEPMAEPVAKAPATQVGDATRHLLERQRLGKDASATPRAIDGTVADLSHQRYLKSFEQPLPAWFGSRVETEVK